jgi:prolyl oligopeptidase
MNVTSGVYPDTRREETVDTLAGLTFPDPYRWLEDGDDPEVIAWQQAENEVTSAFVAGLPNREAVHALVDRYTVSRITGMPRFAGGHWFRRGTPGVDANHPALQVADTPTGPGRVLFDPDAEASAHPRNIEWVSPSPDGRLVAFGLTTGGSENNMLHIVDAETGEELPERIPHVIMDSWTGGAHWLPDSSGFYYLALDPEAGPMRQGIFFHRIGQAPPKRPEIAPGPEVPMGYGLVQIDADGRYAVAAFGLMESRPALVRDLAGSGEWRPFVTEAAGSIAGTIVGDRYIGVTDIDAPRGRLVAIPFDSPTPNDSATWIELIPESDAVLRTVRRAGNRLYITEFVDTYARVRILDLDGALIGEVPLPGKGAIAEQPFPLMNLAPQGHPDDLLFAFSSLTSSPGLYRYHTGSGELEVVQAPKVTLPDVVVEDRWALSPDGARVPYHLVHRHDVDITSPHPTLIYGYGGFNAPWVPQYPGAMAAIITAGGVYVHAHLRGGSELGRDWWQQGRMRQKQNCYRDLYAIAEALIADGVTTAEQLAVTGGSNGGLMAGVALTQRPDLWAVSVPQVPFLDCIGGCRYSYGLQTTIAEFGNPEDPDDVRNLAGFSPYHLVRDGERYPATFVVAGDTDPRCPPWHSRKFVARLQEANASDASILLRVWADTGHGWSTGRLDAVRQATEWMAFVFDRLGLEAE